MPLEAALKVGGLVTLKRERLGRAAFILLCAACQFSVYPSF